MNERTKARDHSLLMKVCRDWPFVFYWFGGGALNLKLSVWSFETVDSISEGIPSVWLIISFTASVSQSVAETWQKGLQVLSQVSYDVDSTPCETLLLRAASFVYENLTKGDTLERYDTAYRLFVIFPRLCFVTHRSCNAFFSGRLALSIFFDVVELVNDLAIYAGGRTSYQVT